jgi:hypothetical protein
MLFPTTNETVSILMKFVLKREFSRRVRQHQVAGQNRWQNRYRVFHLSFPIWFLARDRPQRLPHDAGSISGG